MGRATGELYAHGERPWIGGGGPRSSGSRPPAEDSCWPAGNGARRRGPTATARGASHMRGSGELCGPRTNTTPRAGSSCAATGAGEDHEPRRSRRAGSRCGRAPTWPSNLNPRSRSLSMFQGAEEFMSRCSRSRLMSRLSPRILPQHPENTRPSRDRLRAASTHPHLRRRAGDDLIHPTSGSAQWRSRGEVLDGGTHKVSEAQHRYSVVPMLWISSNVLDVSDYTEPCAFSNGVPERMSGCRMSAAVARQVVRRRRRIVLARSKSVSARPPRRARAPMRSRGGPRST